jgi:hypothetical protein
MNFFCSALFIIFFATSSFAQTVINSESSSKWSFFRTWDLKRAPLEGDIIIINAGHTIELDENISLNDVVIRIYGTLRLKPGKNLQLSAKTVINVFMGGEVVSDSKGADNYIRIGESIKYRGNTTFNSNWGSGVVKGLATAAVTTGDVDHGEPGFTLGMIQALWQDFNVFKVGDKRVHMIWTTGHESGARVFEIERGYDSKDWTVIGTVQTPGNLSPINIYTFIDNAPGTGTIFYRVKQIDPDGRTKFTSTRVVKLELDRTTLTLYPNPTQDFIKLNFGKTIKEKTDVRILSASGQLIKSVSVQAGLTYYNFDVSRQIPGVYYMQILNADRTAETIAFTKY